MKQPDLGEKIVELRKAKGYTQEELVEKCNLNVRTLQRIEAGVVIPRAYTVKIIFAALDYNFYESADNTSSKFKGTLKNIASWFVRVYKDILDEFNFKKHPTNKVSILLILTLSILLIVSLMRTASESKDESSIRTIIENKNTEFIHWFNSGQIDSLGALYLDTASVLFDTMFPLFYDNLPAITKRENITSYYTLFHNQGVRFEKKSKKMIITDLIVVDIGIISLIDDSTSNNGVYFSQWLNVDEKWQIENELFTFDK